MTAAEKLTADLTAHPSAALRIAAPSADIVNVAFCHTRRSKFNPRTRFDHEPLVELAVNIYERTTFDAQGNVTRSGIEQNLLGRPDPTQEGEVEIAAGERRQRAVELLVQGLTVKVKVGDDANGLPIMGERFYQVPASYPMPFRVSPMTDAELIETATLENVMRQEMTPMEEADAFMALIGAGRTAEYVALNIATVKSRVQLAAGLGREARKLLDEGEITLEQAKLIATASGALKKALTEQARSSSGTYTLKNLIKAGAFLVEHAIFDVEASGLRIEEGGLLGDIPAKFTDHKGALNCQLEALEATRAEEETSGKWGKVEVVPVDSPHANLPHQDWVTRPHGMPPHLILICSTTTGKTAHSELYVRSAEAQEFKRQQAQAQQEAKGKVTPGAASSGAQPDPSGPAETGPKIREAAHVIAHQTRAQVVQGKLASDPKLCLALTCDAQSRHYGAGSRHMDLSAPTPIENGVNMNDCRLARIRCTGA